ncbi:MAG TPA: hypothetical protein PLI09_21195 [Candidatus Hydrogenedentes bacterium]|nr:hypothetical protein [Candidatus Hydrogenedentota bacterium]
MNTWLDRKAMAGILGVTLAHFNNHIQPYLDQKHVKRRGRKCYFNAPAVVKLRGELLKRKVTGEVDKPNSTWLEEFRKERTLLSKLEREMREGNLLRREEVHESLGQLAAILRNAGETLKRQFGAEAQDILNEALEEFERRVDGQFSVKEKG